MAVCAEQELKSKYLLAEQIKEAAETKRVVPRKTEANSSRRLPRWRPNFEPRINLSSPPDRLNDSRPSGGPDGSPPGAPSDGVHRHGHSHLNYILDKIEEGEVITANDYRLSREPKSATSASTASNALARQDNVQMQGQGSWEAQARTIIITQIEDVKTGENKPPGMGGAFRPCGWNGLAN